MLSDNMGACVGLRVRVILASKKERQSRDHTGIWKDLAWEPQGCLGSGLVGQLCLEIFSLKRIEYELSGPLWIPLGSNSIGLVICI